MCCLLMWILRFTQNDREMMAQNDWGEPSLRIKKGGYMILFFKMLSEHNFSIGKEIYLR